MAEKKFKTVDIKGKEYVEVNERVKYFVRVYVGWSIETELLSNVDGICVFKATIKDENGRVMATGHAYEKESSSFINKTSYIENCETSAVGRALGFLGIGIDTSIASSDEVANAVKNQPSGGDNKVDFDKVRTELEKINDLDSLAGYWDSLNLSEKQKQILRDDFNKRREEIKGSRKMTWSDEPTSTQLGALYNMIKWKATGDSATKAVQWLAENATRREVSYELKRVKELYQTHALNASNCFVGDIWEGFEPAKEQE